MDLRLRCVMSLELFNMNVYGVVMKNVNGRVKKRNAALRSSRDNNTWEVPFVAR